MVNTMTTQEKPNLIEQLPKEIMYKIFSEFPVKDLLRLRSVCKSWLSLVSSPDFVQRHMMIIHMKIIHNIFLRLSVHDLLLLRSVCKSWLSIISSRDFTEAHLSVSTNDPHFTYHRLLLISDAVDYYDEQYQAFSTCSVYSLLHGPYAKRRVTYDTDDDQSLLGELLDQPVLEKPVSETFNDKDIDYSTDESLLDEPESETFTEEDIDYSTDESLLDEPVLDEPVAETLNDEDIDYSTDVAKAFKDIDYVVGTCNGLVCLARIDGHVIFWNPSTRKSRRLPKLNKFSPLTTYEGFCYDILNDDFKLFSIFFCPSRGSEYKVSVYSSKSDCWRLIGDFPYDSVSSTEGEFANGALHWMGRCHTEKENVIVSLDIITEEFQDILLPKYGEHVSSPMMDTFGENLSVIFEFKDIRRDFWVMKERGVEEPWTKLFSIPFNMDGLPLSVFTLRPICISVNGEILISSDTTVVLYNSEDQTLRGLPDRWFKNLSVFSYVESLVSPYQSKLVHM